MQPDDYLLTGLDKGEEHTLEVTEDNIKKSQYYNHFVNGLKLSMSQIKALLNAPSLREARKIQARMPKRIPDFAAYQVRTYWGFKDSRVEHCFCCGSPIYFLERSTKDVSTDLSTQAVYFTTGGNWPSGILDIEDEKIHILICDKCVDDNRDKMFIIKEEPRAKRTRVTRISFKQYRENQAPF